jgi:hypothetical protein
MADIAKLLVTHFERKARVTRCPLFSFPDGKRITDDSALLQRELEKRGLGRDRLELPE